MTTETIYGEVVDCETGIQTTHELSAEQVQQIQDARAAFEAAEAERVAAAETLAALKASAKAKLVAGTPLSEEEAATLVI